MAIPHPYIFPFARVVSYLGAPQGKRDPKVYDGDPSLNNPRQVYTFKILEIREVNLVNLAKIPSGSSVC